MLILLPLSRSDAHLAKPLADHMHTLGGVKRHDLVLFYTGEEALKAADYVEDTLRNDFHSVTKVASEVLDESGWPRSANHTFRNAIKWAEQTVGYQGILYFFEADNVPLRSSWADDLQDEFLRSQKPCLGVVHETVWTSADGTRRVDGTHLVGTSLYAIPMSPYSKLWRHIGAQSRTPFDVFLKNELVPNSASTNLIQHNWNTVNYRRDGDRIVCDSAVEHKSTHGTTPTRPDSLVAAVRSDAVVLHGCKDGSLISLFNKNPSRKK